MAERFCLTVGELVDQIERTLPLIGRNTPVLVAIRKRVAEEGEEESVLSEFKAGYSTEATETRLGTNDRARVFEIVFD